MVVVLIDMCNIKVLLDTGSDISLIISSLPFVNCYCVCTPALILNVTTTSGSKLVTRGHNFVCFSCVGKTYFSEFVIVDLPHDLPIDSVIDWKLLQCHTNLLQLLKSINCGFVATVSHLVYDTEVLITAMMDCDNSMAPLPCCIASIELPVVHEMFESLVKEYAILIAPEIMKSNLGEHSIVLSLPNPICVPPHRLLIIYMAGVRD